MSNGSLSDISVKFMLQFSAFVSVEGKTYTICGGEIHIPIP